MRNQIFTRVAVSTLALACLPVAVLAQQASNTPPAQPSPDDKPVATLKVQAREVLLPVTVRDKKGAFVTSLDKGDFTLTEDGRPQVIKSFSHETNLPYKLGLLVDTSRSVSGALENERKAGGNLWTRCCRPNRAPRIRTRRSSSTLTARWSCCRTSRPRARSCITNWTTWAPRSRRATTRRGRRRPGDERERPTHSRGGTQLYDAIFLASDELMKHKDGRKALVVFSDGVDRGSKDTMNDAVDAADRANVVVYTIYFKGEEERNSNFGFPGRPPRRDGLSRRRRRVSGGRGGYPGGGGQRRGGEPKPAVDGKKIMAQIAERTGGHAYEAKKKDDLEPSTS